MEDDNIVARAIWVLVGMRTILTKQY